MGFFLRPIGHAAFDIREGQIQRNPIEGRLDRLNLREDVVTLTFRSDHFLETFNLALDPAEMAQEFRVFQWLNSPLAYRPLRDSCDLLPVFILYPCRVFLHDSFPGHTRGIM